MSDFDYLKIVERMMSVINASIGIRESMLELIDYGASISLDLATVWEYLRTRDFVGDAEIVRSGLRHQLEAYPIPPEYTGFYFGLDGLNAARGKGIEFGCSKSFDVQQDDGGVDWAYQCDYYPFEVGSTLLIDLYVNTVEQASLADYFGCIAYTGLALREAFTVLPHELTLGAAKARAVCFGPHDGDLYRLGLLDADGFKVDCGLKIAADLAELSSELAPDLAAYVNDLIKSAGLDENGKKL